VNGALVQTVEVLGDMYSSGEPLRIGGNAVWGEFFSGLIDELRIYNRPLSSDEILSDRSTPIGRPARARQATATVLPAPTFSAGTFADGPPLNASILWDESATDVLA